MESWIKVLIGLQVLGFGVAVPLLAVWLKSRMENLARETSEKTLADYRKGHAKELEEFGHYARERYRVYPALYRQVRIAADLFTRITGFNVRPDFRDFDEVRAVEYFDGYKLPASIRVPILAELRAGGRGAAAKSLDALHDRIEFHRGDRAFNRARNLEVLNLLYLSDEVQASMDDVRAAISRVSVQLDPSMRDPDEPRRMGKTRELVDAMNAKVSELYRVMREELRRV